MNLINTARHLAALFVLAFMATIVAPVTPFADLLGVQAAQAQTVAAISVSGNDRVDDATVRSYLTIRVGDVASNSAIQGSIASLNATGLFSQVSVRFASGTLLVSVSENLVVSGVLFEGNNRFSDEQLVALVNLASSGTFTESRLNADIRSIQLTYDQAGYTDVDVTARTEVTTTGRMRVTFVINEGVRSGIAAINFTGNNSFSAPQLKDVITTKESHLLSWLFLDDEYSDAKLELDKLQIQKFYADRGFPDARVLSAVVEYDSAQQGYFINFAISEGERYTFGNVDIQTSISGLNTDALWSYVRTYSGGAYSQSDLQKTISDLAFRATGQGYAFADVRPRLNRDPATGTISVSYLIDEGARVYVERIDIIGNTKTRDYVIRRELDFAEGDPFNRAMVSRGKAKIESLGFFSSVNISSDRGSASDKVNLTIAVTETASGNYGATAGYDSSQGILGELSLTERNFLGRGQFLRVAVGASTQGQSYDLSFTEPRFMGSNISAGIDLFKEIQDETDSFLYGSDITGGTLRFGAPITEQFSATVFTGLQMAVYEDDDADSDIIADAGETYTKGTLGYVLNFSNVDDPAKPRNGFVAELRQTYAFIDHHYLSSEVRARYLIEVLPDSGIVASVRGQAGIINDFSGAGVSPLETFQGGPRLVRGFEFGGLGPRSATGEPLGTTMFAGISAEVEFPIPVIPESYGLRGAVWADLGYMGDPGSGPAAVSGTDQNIRTSAGASLIWDSPLGPLRGDYAFFVDGATGDIPQRFQFTISTLL